jgi:hypothetical protein
MDTRPIDHDPKRCDACGLPLDYLANGMQSWTPRGERRLHVECALRKPRPAADDDTPPPEPMRYAPGEITGDGS